MQAKPSEGNGPNDARSGAATKVLRFGLIYLLLLALAEGILRSIAWAQDKLGWALADLGVPFDLVGVSVSLSNGLMSFIALAGLFAFLEWWQLGFNNFRERYSEGLLYSSIALGIATLIQAGVFYALQDVTVDPLIKHDQLGPFLIAFPILYMLVVGFFDYWLHRALHDIPILWRLHAIHHQIENLNAARSYSHWAQDALYLAVITVPVAFLIESPEQHIVLITTLYLVSNYYMHSDNPALAFPPALRHILADNVYHHHHHSRAIEHWGRNYCSFFSFYDRMFGTQYLPEEDVFYPTGIDGYRPLDSWRDYLIRPFTEEG